MSNNTLIKTCTAGGAIPAYRILKFSAADTVVLAAAATDSLIGVSTDIAAASGERCDVVKAGIAYIEAGAATTLGGPVTADSVGKAINAAPATGVNNRIIGFFDEAAAADGDIVRVLLAPGVMQGA